MAKSQYIDLDTEVPSGAAAGLLSELAFQQGLRSGDRVRMLMAFYGNRAGTPWESFFAKLFKRVKRPRTENFRANLSALERGKAASFTLRELLTLSELYEVSPLTFFPLGSREKFRVLHQTLDDDYKPAPRRFQPRGSSYCFPSERLVGCDTMAVVVDLKPNAKSDEHWHSGDELLFILSGSATAHFPLIGAEIRLKKNDYVHFNAEQMHYLRAGVQGCQHFVLRFDQLTGGLRRRAQAALRNLYSADGSPKKDPDGMIACLQSDDFCNWYFSEWEERQRRIVLPETGFPDVIGNPVGLSQFLKSHGVKPATLGKAFNKTQVNKLLNGVFDAEFGIEDLSKISKLIGGTLDAFFYHYTFPRVPNIVRIRESCNYREVPHENGDVCYSVPDRSLLGSNTSVALLSVPPGKNVEPNYHAGFEILIPISGTLQLRLMDTNELIVLGAKDRQFVFFDSSIEHSVLNPGRAEARALVVRVFS